SSGGNGGSIAPIRNSEVRANYSCLEGEGVLGGAGNINRDPLFLRSGWWDDGGTADDAFDETWTPGDYHFSPGSPAIDAGSLEGAPPADGDGAVDLTDVVATVSASSLLVSVLLLRRGGCGRQRGDRHHRRQLLHRLALSGRFSGSAAKAASMRAGRRGGWAALPAATRGRLSIGPG